MQVSFIIPLYNGLALTRECLRTLQATVPPGLSHEIIFVDDGSKDGTRDWLGTLPSPCRHLLNERNLGFAGTCNQGAHGAHGELLCFLNNDLVLQAGWLEPLLAAHRRQGRSVGLTGNLQFRVDDGALDHAGITVTRQAKLEHVRTLPEPAHGISRVFAVTAACCVIERSVFLAAGGFDEAYRNGAEDVALAIKLAKDGRPSIVVLDSAVRHHVSASRGPTSPRDEANSRRLFSQWPAEIEREVAKAWALPSDQDNYVKSGLEAWADRLFLAGFRRQPSRRALLLARSAIWRESIRWQTLFGEQPATEPAPPLDPVGLVFDQSYPEAWLNPQARLSLPARQTVRNLFVNGFLHTPASPKDSPAPQWGLRICVNGLQTRDVFPLPAGNFSVGLDSPASLPGQATHVTISLLQAAGIPAVQPPGTSSRQHSPEETSLPPAPSTKSLLRLTEVVADDQVAITFWHGVRSGRFLPADAKQDDPRRLPSWDGDPVITGRPQVFAAEGWYDLETGAAGCWRWSAGRAANLVWWDGVEPVTACLEFRSQSKEGSRLTLHAETDLVWQSVPITSAAYAHRIILTLNPGQNLWQWNLEGPAFHAGDADSRILGFMLENLRITKL